MELKHFSHDHILTLIDVAPKSDRKKEILCYGCQQSITSSAYNCGECNYFLHKKCAELSEKIEHPMHQDHALTLLSHPPPYPKLSWVCNVCQISECKRFTYNCSKCHFNIHVSCAFEEGLFEHEGHHHPLTLVRRPILLFCDACRTEEKEVSYRCTVCPFWIHKSCASLPKTVKRSDDDHSLRLTYSLPEKFHSHSHSCNICHNIVQRTEWIYCCEACRYFAHLKCTTAKQKPSTQRFSLREVSKQYPPGYLGFTDGPVQVLGIPHSHPIKFKSCRDLSFALFRCVNCKMFCNGKTYCCPECDFYIDVNCARISLTRIIKHESHDHHLYLQNRCYDNSKCNACGDCLPSIRYACSTCNFSIESLCANLPTTIRHEWDRHPLTQTYPPFSDHPEEFICEICEEELHPNYWIYRCRDCDQAFHYKCVHYSDKYSKIKFGDNFKFDIHPQHNLQLVQKSTNKAQSLCYQCGKQKNGKPVLECAPCNFQLCIKCAWQISLSIPRERREFERRQFGRRILERSEFESREIRNKLYNFFID